MAPTARTTELIQTVMASLDYDALGEIYCDDGGRAFWEDRRQPVIEMGSAWASELAQRLETGGRSLYVGAGVAELPALITEVNELQRVCRATNLRRTECDAVNAALRAAELTDRVQLECVEAASVGESGFDHLSLVSVLDDPETFPWVSSVTYGRAAPWDLDVDAFAAERDAVRSLVVSVLEKLAPPAWVTTTTEEVPWLLEGAEARGWVAEADDTMVETALVGDPIGFLSVRESA